MYCVFLLGLCKGLRITKELQGIDLSSRYKKNLHNYFKTAMCYEEISRPILFFWEKIHIKRGTVHASMDGQIN